MQDFKKLVLKLEETDYNEILTEIYKEDIEELNEEEISELCEKEVCYDLDENKFFGVEVGWGATYANQNNCIYVGNTECGDFATDGLIQHYQGKIEEIEFMESEIGNPNE